MTGEPVNIAAIEPDLASILVTYGLAGSQAYGVLFGTLQIYLIFPFVFAGTLVVVFAYRWISGFISILTFTKGVVLVLMVLVTMVVGSKASYTVKDDWAYIGKPFLISTVALGGAVNVLPVIFPRVAYKERDLRGFLIATIAGLTVVYLLNIVWCYFVLRIVPQTGIISLEGAQEQGQIATVPLIEIIRKNFPEFSWIASLVNVFIVISISVSFIAMGTGMRHMLDGFIKRNQDNEKEGNFPSFTFKEKLKFIFTLKHSLWSRGVLYIFAFGFVFVVAQTNPKAFIITMEYVTSLALNLGNGVFLATMLGSARVLFTSNEGGKPIPFKLPNFIYKMRYFVMFYFTFAIVYDIASLVSSVFAYQ